MDSNQLSQMALSAIVRCNEKADFFELINVLCGRSTWALRRKGFDTIKTFGAGKMFSKRQWHYWLIQMIQLDLITIDYSDHDNLKVLEKGHQVLKGNLIVSLKRFSDKSMTITRKGIPIEIDVDIYDSIDWRKTITELGSMVYWNYKEELHVDVNEIIPKGIEERERVIAKYLEIATTIYNLKIDRGVIVIPKKVDRDIYGNEVLPLSLPFEECLLKLEQFIKTTGHYPRMNAVAEEVALRKWYREVGHDIIEITPEQREKFKQFTQQYPMSSKPITKDQ